MSVKDLVEAGKSSIRVAKMVITIDYGSVTCQWVDAEGRQIATCLGRPAMCTNSPDREKCRCVHLSIYWKHVIEAELDCYDPAEYDATTELENWLNQQPIAAAECVSVGAVHITRGTWHARKNRWMWGPKEPRR